MNYGDGYVAAVPAKNKDIYRHVVLLFVLDR